MKHSYIIRPETCVDLTHVIEQDMPVYPGDVQPKITRIKTLERDGVNLSSIELGSHTGTHVDAPAHFVKNGHSIDKVRPQDLIGEAVVLDFSDKPVGSGITKEDLQRYTIDEGVIVLLYTGTSQHWSEEWTRTNYAYLELSGAEFLVQKRVKAVGIDTLSIEKYDASEPSTHKVLLGAGIPIIESLSSELASLIGKRVLLFCLPLKLKGCDGAPARVIAYPLED